MNDASGYRVIRVTGVLEAAVSIQAKAANALSQAEAEKAVMLADAIANKSDMPDNHWEREHVARLRFEAAKAVHEAITTMAQEHRGDVS